VLKLDNWPVGSGPGILAAQVRSEPRKRATIVREKTIDQ
jgi:hypothetical protein